MKFDNMHEFLVLAQVRSYWAAAEQLFISQATLSRHIKEMEDELGVSLFIRTTKRIELSEFGMILLPYAQQAVALQDTYTSAIKQHVLDMENELRIGVIPGWDETQIADFLSDYQTAMPDTRISIDEDETDQLMFKITHELCDYVFIREKSGASGGNLSRQFFYQDALTAYFSTNHPFAGYKEISLAELKNESFMMSEDSSLSGILGAQACRDSGFDPVILFRGNREQTIGYLRKRLGVGLMFGIPYSTTIANNIAAVPIVPPIYADVNLVYIDSNMTEAKQKFLDYFISWRK
ncbi:MAG: LysR family transcriptional regulator [Lachnospiraceae bacterium]|nr:LysR family transcriptional regulator [Lachnospiraceae bacterium]